MRDRDRMAMLPDNYALPDGYRINSCPMYFAANACEIENQFAVYSVARQLFDCKRLSCVVDVGCGAGDKLVQLWPDSETVGIDWGANLKQSRMRYPTRQWLDFDLEQPGLESVLPDWSGCLVICADVIEHLMQPEHLLNSLRQIVQQGATCLLSTPERDLCRGRHDLGPPANLCHVREWNLGELFTLVSAYCPIQHVQLVPWRPTAERAETILMQL